MKTKQYVVPQWIHRYVASVAAGYEERIQALHDGVTDDVAGYYHAMNDAIREGLKAACEPGEQRYILDAIIHVKGYQKYEDMNSKGYRSYPEYPGGRRRFYEQKRRTVYEIAVRLGVIEKRD